VFKFAILKLGYHIIIKFLAIDIELFNLIEMRYFLHELTILKSI